LAFRAGIQPPVPAAFNGRPRPRPGVRRFLKLAAGFDKIVKNMKPSYEDELKRLGKAIRILTDAALFPKKVEVRGRENFVGEGPNLIIGNHIGSYKDVGLLFRIVPRPIFFTANKMIFTKKQFNFLVRKHLHRHLKDFGLFINLMLKPFKSLIVDYISSNIARIGTIPVDMYHSNRENIESCQRYLRAGKAVITLQGRGRVKPKEPNPYVAQFKRGASIMAHNLSREGIPVPVTPLAIFGTHIAFPVPGTIIVNVGPAMFIEDFRRGDESATIEAFRQALEARVKSLLLEILRSR